MSASNSGSPLVSLDNIEVVYASAERGLAALGPLDLVVEPGEFVSVIGPSGCGKSTLLRVTGGLQAPTHGTVTLAGRPPAEAQQRKQIGFAFQDSSLLPWRTVRENIVLPLQVNRSSSGEDPDALIDLVGLSAFRSYYPFQLSGGMQQRVALARALVTSPSLLLMDEPFGALDELSRSTMRHELLRLWRSGTTDRTVVLVTHSIAEAVLLSDRVIVLTPRPGRVVADLAIDLPRPGRQELELEPGFLAYCRELRGLLEQRSAA